MNIVLPDGSVKELEEGATVADVAASIGAGLARAALAGIVNDTPVDLDTVVSDGDSVAIVTAKSDEGLELMRHSTAHLLAAALTDMYPGVKFGVGPAIENGFYYDIELPEGVTVSPDDFAAIEARMAEIAKSGAAIVRREVSRDEAREIFTDQPLKLELIDELPEDETISIYQLGDFTDLCRGPHVPDTGKLGAYKLTKVAGAYWKGDSDNEMLTRIYGTAFFKQKELDEHVRNLEEAEKRGLLNLKTTPACAPYLMKEKNVRLFADHKIYSETELHARYEILLENYSKVLRIEALTMLDMVQTDILPAVSDYTAKLVRTAAEKKSLLGDAAGGYEYKTAARLSALTETASEDAAKLSDALLQAGELPSAQEAADFYQAEVFKDMAELRLAVDEMETLTSRACWPYPTYGELLFSVR